MLVFALSSPPYSTTYNVEMFDDFVGEAAVEQTKRLYASASQCMQPGVKRRRNKCPLVPCPQTGTALEQAVETALPNFMDSQPPALQFPLSTLRCREQFLRRFACSQHHQPVGKASWTAWVVKSVYYF